MNLFKKSITRSLEVIAVVFAVVPESGFELIRLIPCAPDAINVIVVRMLVLVFASFVSLVAHVLFLHFRNSVILEDNDCIIEIKYGDLLSEENCKRVISFDECFTTRIGSAPEDINPKSICGQYISLNADFDIAELIKTAGLKPEKTSSQFNGQTRYLPGSIVPNGDDLLLAFAPLNKSGRAEFSTRSDYLDCLSTLWDEIYKYHGQEDVSIPIFAAGATGFVGGSGLSLSQQELLDMIIWSYKLSARKIKKPQKLRIVCKRQAGFSINNVSA